MSTLPAGAPGPAPPPPALPQWSGLLPIDKPSGLTSHDVVDRVRRRLRCKQVGHLGTLDPAANGLLLLAIGAATRCAIVWQGGTKTYEATARFGLVTDSQDLDGKPLYERPVLVGEAEVRAAALAFAGELSQVPPMVSALKHQGRRLHALARAGETVERAPRAVRVEPWEWLAFAMPEATFRVRCSGGTYVRTLVHDLGGSLGCGATLAALRRTASEPFALASACPWAEFETLEAPALLARHGIPLDAALAVLPGVVLDPPGVEAVGRGQPAPVDAGAAPLGAGPRSVVLRDALGHALALGELRAAEPGAQALACPHVVFPWAVREGRAA